jgi:hypothetical protein
MRQQLDCNAANRSNQNPEGCRAGTPDAGVVNEIEDPDPAANTNKWYSEDGYGGGGFGSPAYGGGSYTNCSDTTQPGVTAVVNFLNSLPRKIKPNCDPNHLLPAQQLQSGILRIERLHRSIYTTTFRTIPCQQFPSSNRAAGSMAIRRRPR